MRIIWKERNHPDAYKRIKYRGYYLTGAPRGWEIDVPGDDNLYLNNYCAMNAIDKHLDGDTVRVKTPAKRRSYGIQIVGKKVVSLNEE